MPIYSNSAFQVKSKAIIKFKQHWSGRLTKCAKNDNSKLRAGVSVNVFFNLKNNLL
jgi:hypothetical protein